MKAIGFAAGQIGDLIIQTVACRAFKEQYPNSQLTFGIAEKYRDILPLFFGNTNIYDFHIWEGYDNWPSLSDREYCYYRGYDQVFNAMPPHTRQDWYNHHTYAEENCLRFGLKIPSDLSYELIKWFSIYDDCKKNVTITLFPSKGTQMDKGLKIEEAEKLCVSLKALGYNPIQLGGKFEVKLKNALSPHFSIFEAAKVMVSSAFHITADTGFSSIAAGYKQPTLGIYGINYPDMKDCFSHLPPNPNAIYIKNRNPQTILAEEIIEFAKAGGLIK
jgi:ADP-heptose:LPS heptosyltransferase